MRTEWQLTQVEWKFTYDMRSVPAVIFDRIASKTQKQSSHMLQSEKSYQLSAYVDGFDECAFV